MPMSNDPVPQVPGYKLTDQDRWLIIGMNNAHTGESRGNIGALHFDGPVLMQLLWIEKRNPRKVDLR